jgi:hypothetical protein
MGGHVDSEKIDFSPLHNLLNGVQAAPAGAQKLDPLAVQANLMIGPDGQRHVELHDKNRPEHSILLKDQGDGRYTTVATGAGNNKDGTTKRVYHLANGQELATDGADLFGRPVPGDLRVQSNKKISPDGVQSLLTSGKLDDQEIVTEPSSPKYLHLGRSI